MTTMRQPVPGPSTTVAGTAAAPVRRLRSLAGMRVVAAFAIFLAHINVLLPIPHTYDLIVSLSSGVTFFFVLSGFVLTWAYSGRDGPGRFYRRRFARLWPTVFLATALPVFFALAFPDPELPVDVGQLLTLGTLSATFLLAWAPSQLESPNPVLWALSALAFFYLVFPFVVRPLLGRTPRALAWWAVGLVTLVWSVRVTLWVVYPPPAELDVELMGESTALILGTYSPVARLPEFLFGMVVAAAVRQGWRGISVRASLALIVIGYFVLWLFRDAAWRVALPYDAQNQVMLPLFGLLIAAYAAGELAGRRSWLSSGAMSRLATLVFTFIMFHFLVLIPVALSLYPDMTVVDFFFEPVAPTWTHLPWALVVLVSSLVMAALLHRFYEEPLNRILGPRQPKVRVPAAGASRSVINGGQGGVESTRDFISWGEDRPARRR